MTLAVLLAVMSMESHGGVADQITNLALELPKYGVQPAVVVRNPLSLGHVYAAMLREAGIRFEAIQYRRYKQIYDVCQILVQVALPLAIVDALLRRKTLAASRRTIWSVLRRLGYAGLDLVFFLRLLRHRVWRGVRLVHFRKPDAWSWIAKARKLGMATIYTEDTIPQEHTRKYYEGLNCVESSIDAVTAVSSASAKELESYLPMHRPIPVIPNLVVVNASSSQLKEREGHHRFVVASIARLSPEKDIETLLSAAHHASKQNHHLLFKVFGDGPLRVSSQCLAHELELDSYVEFCGAFDKTDLPAIMDEIDVVVLSTHYEGFGVALAEGMAFGKPVVATAVGGVMDVVADGVTGILVPEGDADALAIGILTLSLDPRLYTNMALAARERYLARFTPERVVPQYVALYERLAK